MQLGDVPELKAGCQFAPEVAAGVVQGCKCLILLVIFAADGDFNGGVPGIGADVDLGNVDLSETGVVHFKPNDFSEFFAYGFTHS